MDLQLKRIMLTNAYISFGSQVYSNIDLYNQYVVPFLNVWTTTIGEVLLAKATSTTLCNAGGKLVNKVVIWKKEFVPLFENVFDLAGNYSWGNPGGEWMTPLIGA